MTKEEGSSATDYVTDVTDVMDVMDVTDVRNKEEKLPCLQGRGKQKEEGKYN